MTTSHINVDNISCVGDGHVDKRSVFPQPIIQQRVCVVHAGVWQWE